MINGCYGAVAGVTGYAYLGTEPNVAEAMQITLASSCNSWDRSRIDKERLFEERHLQRQLGAITNDVTTVQVKAEDVSICAYAYGEDVIHVPVEIRRDPRRPPVGAISAQAAVAGQYVATIGAAQSRSCFTRNIARLQDPKV